METKKTIIVSVLTTLATIFVVAVIMHLCCGQCGQNTSCSGAKTECYAGESKCSKNAKCGKEKKCHKSDEEDDHHHDMVKEVIIEKEVAE